MSEYGFPLTGNIKCILYGGWGLALEISVNHLMLFCVVLASVALSFPIRKAYTPLALQTAISLLSSLSEFSLHLHVFTQALFAQQWYDLMSRFIM